MEDFISALSDIAVSNVSSNTQKSLPPPGTYTVRLTKVEPSKTLDGSIRREYGRPLFEVEGLEIVGPFPYEGRYMLWQRLPMTDVMEFGQKRNYLRDVVRAYNNEAEFTNALDAFGIILEEIENGKEINVKVGYFAEDYKGAKAAKEAEGLNVRFNELDAEQQERRNEIDRSSKVRGFKPFDNGDGTYKSVWTSPFGNDIQVRLNILKFYNSQYDPFNQTED